MRIVIQIPCFNEENTLAETIADIRSAMSDFDDVIVLVIDDGSVDETVSVAMKAGADFVAQHGQNRGLAHAYMTGLAASLNLGADIIVNTDADNQYMAKNIPDLVRPIINDKFDLVVGSRPINQTEHFSSVKKFLQRLGSRTVRFLSSAPVEDATSGFRAMSRHAAIRLNTFSSYTYTLETLIQAGRSGLRVTSVDIETNPPTRPSRLMSSVAQYVFRSTVDMLRVFTIYAPFRSYSIAGLVPLSLAFILGVRYLYLLFLVDPTRSHAPSLIAAAILAILGFLLIAIGVLGELLNINRRLLEEQRYEQRSRNAENGTVSGRCEFELLQADRQKEG